MKLDLVLVNGDVYDGLGHVPVRTDVGVAGGRVVALGDLSRAVGVRRLDALGLAICPGFIDVHTHADFTLPRPDHPQLLEPMLRQGVTTVVGGNCGVSLAPLADGEARRGQMAFYDVFLGAAPEGLLQWQTFGGMLDTLERQGTVLNVGVLAPHGIVRMAVMGDRSEPARGDDLAALERLVDQCLEQGALGLSTGLQYFPGMYSDLDELLALARVVRRHDGVFTAHLRSYLSTTLPQAIDEVLEIGRRAEVPVQLSHLFWIPVTPDRLAPLVHAAMGALSRLHRRLPLDLPLDAGARPLLERVARHQAAGYPVGVDAMPTAAGFTHLIALFPPWVIGESREAILARLADPATRARIRADIEGGSLAWPHRDGNSWSLNLLKVLGWGAAWIMAVVSEKNQPLCGRSFVEIAKERGQHPFDVMCDLLIEEQGRVLVYETGTHPGDDFVELALRATLCHPSVSIVTDAILMGYGQPSHLFHDAYPRFLGRYARDRGLLPLREAIRKCTSLPASQLGLRDRGVIRRGAHADLVVFDPTAIASRSTPEDPGRRPEGVRHVLVNGHVVVSPDGYHPEPLSGQVIRG